MQRSHRAALAALQLFALLACAGSSTTDAHGATRARASASHVTAAHVVASTRGSMTRAASAAQRRRTRRRAGDALTPGVWGGAHIRFEVTARGAAIEYDCAHGTINVPIVVDRAGRFDVAGAHYEERGGPVRLGDSIRESGRGYAVRFRGRVGGSLMRLTVTRGRTLVGSFNLARDREPELTKCR
jgi:hypothetical protein